MTWGSTFQLEMVKGRLVFVIGTFDNDNLQQKVIRRSYILYLVFGSLNLVFAMVKLKRGWFLSLELLTKIICSRRWSQDSVYRTWECEFGIWGLVFGFWNCVFGIWNCVVGYWNGVFGTFYTFYTQHPILRWKKRQRAMGTSCRL